MEIAGAGNERRQRSRQKTAGYACQTRSSVRSNCPTTARPRRAGRLSRRARHRGALDDCRTTVCWTARRNRLAPATPLCASGSTATARTSPSRARSYLARTKVREELETTVGDGALLLRLFERLGFHVWFRYQKYREEFRHGDLVIAVDESPIGTFVELEGSEEDILAMARTLERPASDFVLDSYLALFRRHCAAQGSTATHLTPVGNRPTQPLPKCNTIRMQQDVRHRRLRYRPRSCSRPVWVPGCTR